MRSHLDDASFQNQTGCWWKYAWSLQNWVACKKKYFCNFNVTLEVIIYRKRATWGTSITDISLELRLRKAYITVTKMVMFVSLAFSRFVLGYVRPYARHLGMDPNKAFDACCLGNGFKNYSGNKEYLAKWAVDSSKKIFNYVAIEFPDLFICMPRTEFYRIV